MLLVYVTPVLQGFSFHTTTEMIFLTSKEKKQHPQIKPLKTFKGLYTPPCSKNSVVTQLNQASNKQELLPTLPTLLTQELHFKRH